MIVTVFKSLKMVEIRRHCKTFSNTNDEVSKMTPQENNFTTRRGVGDTLVRSHNKSSYFFPHAVHKYNVDRRTKTFDFKHLSSESSLVSRLVTLQ